MSERNIAVVGGPGAGKTVWLGALLDWIGSGKERQLHFDGAPANSQTLKGLRSPIAQGKYHHRTPTGSKLDLEIPLETRGNLFPPTKFHLRASDYAGEELDRIFEDRNWSNAWRDRSKAAGLLLLVRSEATAPLPRLELPPPVDPLAPPSPNTHFNLLTDPKAIPPPNASDPVRTPTVLSLVELIQGLRHERGLEPGERPAPGSLRIGVLISAWDALEEQWKQAGPDHYVKQLLPLLDDVLWNGFHSEDVRYFGLSATGGDLHDPDYRKKYLKKPGGDVYWMDAYQQIRRSTDVALPLYWSLFGETALNLGQP